MSHLKQKLNQKLADKAELRRFQAVRFSQIRKSYEDLVTKSVSNSHLTLKKLLGELTSATYGLLSDDKLKV